MDAATRQQCGVKLCLRNFFVTREREAYHSDDTDCQRDMNHGIDAQCPQDPVVGSKYGQLHNARHCDAKPHQHLTPSCNTPKSFSAIGIAMSQDARSC